MKYSTLWTGTGWLQGGVRATLVERQDWTSRRCSSVTCGEFDRLDWGNVQGWSLRRKRTALALLILIPTVGEAQAINFAASRS